ncbi:hypothetical protein [Amphritea japonica]|uniref:DUF1127 domain-containing protein n=1 Tax=Amphritea japonica ATCC BAA-1530 TaxID=1278309 RepID=A0A7R6PEE9_9GAMM|nr:hypothetical protein [Amphritea japonica]BBB24867.1 hypothetical protein AMJAP_0268 [Amphritea japonica ATCC BAA-1530]
MLCHEMRTTKTPTTSLQAIEERVNARLRSLPFIQALKDWYAGYCRRQVLVGLLRYDDHILEDMGHTRQELLAISKLPLSADAHEVLKQLKDLRSQ